MIPERFILSCGSSKTRWFHSISVYVDAKRGVAEIVVPTHYWNFNADDLSFPVMGSFEPTECCGRFIVIPELKMLEARKAGGIGITKSNGSDNGARRWVNDGIFRGPWIGEREHGEYPARFVPDAIDFFTGETFNRIDIDMDRVFFDATNSAIGDNWHHQLRMNEIQLTGDGIELLYDAFQKLSHSQVVFQLLKRHAPLGEKTSLRRIYAAKCGDGAYGLFRDERKAPDIERCIARHKRRHPDPTRKTKLLLSMLAIGANN